MHRITDRKQNLHVNWQQLLAINSHGGAQEGTDEGLLKKNTQTL